MKRENLKWEYDEYDGTYTLYFIFYTEDDILTLYLDKDNDWLFTSKLLNEKDTYLYGYDEKSIEEIKEELVDIIEQHYVNEIEYLSSLLEHFRMEG